MSRATDPFQMVIAPPPPPLPKRGEFVSKRVFFPPCQVYEPRIALPVAVGVISEEEDVLSTVRNGMKNSNAPLFGTVHVNARISLIAYLHKWKFMDN